MYINFNEDIQDLEYEKILEKISQLLNSNEIVTMDELECEMIIVQVPGGHGMKGRKFETIRIPSYYIDGVAESCFWDSLSYFLLKYEEKAVNIIPKIKIKNRGKELARKAYKKYNSPIYISDIPSVESSLNLRICVFHLSDKQEIEILYKPKHNKDSKIIYMLLNDNCFFAIKSPKLLLEKTSRELVNTTDFCSLCYEFKKKLITHMCEEFCTYCKSNSCAGKSEQTQFILCKKCNRTLKNQTCFESHKKSGACARSKICPRCMVEYKFNQHDCNFSLCSICFEKYKNDGSDDHTCIMKPKKIKSSKALNTIRIYFDVEAYTNKINNEFVPTCLISQTICNKCEECMQESCLTKHLGFEKIYESDSTKSCINKFIKDLLIIDEINKSVEIVVVAHNLGGFDGLLIYKELLDNFPDDILKDGIIKRGNKIITFHIGKNLQFKDSLLYVPCSLKKLPSLFNIPEKSKGFFPHNFYSEDTLNYIGPMPDKKYFDTNKMSELEAKEFDNFYRNKSEMGIYDIKKEMIDYCRDDVSILRLAMEKFRRKTLSSFAIDPLIDACTIASNCFAIYINNFLPNGVEIISIDRNLKKRYSKEGITWIQIQEKELEKKLISGTSFSGEKRIRLQNGEVVFPDGYDPETRTIFLYHGCYYHGCPKCHYDKILRNGIPGIEYYLKTKRMEDQIRKEFNLVTTWSHDQKVKRLVNPSYNTLWVNLYEKNSFDFRLHPGDSLFGGRTNAFRLLITEDELNLTNSEIKYIDFCSLYPSVQVKYPYPVGKPDIILKKDLPQINEFVSDCGNKYFGLVKLRILPPNDLLYPILPVIINKKLFFPLCIKCSEEQISDSNCDHTDFERSWIGTYVSVEIFQAIEDGYIILELYEIWNFDRSPFLFKSYIQHFIKQKLEASGYPPDILSEEDKESYINHVKEKDGIELTKEDIRKNPPSRTLSKLSLNNLWGKFCQNPDKTQTKICSNYTEFIEAVFESNQILSSLYISDKKAVIDYKVPQEEIKPGRYTNIPIGAFTTAYARLELYRVMKELGDRLLYVDTDSLIFVSSPDKPEPRLGSSLGELTDEITPEFGLSSKGIAFVSTGPKSYSLKVRKSNGDIDFIVKCKGFSITNELSDKINFESMEQIVKGDIYSIKTNSVRFQPMKYGGVKISDNKKTLKNTYTKRRIIEDYKTLPWGFK